ncbi:unnamed protein product [Symbiodinium natans]|uniref:E3 ubiquitin-protein ligase HERC2 n=1 Tax=Symbiodinium natans TaxID=878477 RepID=A0A812QK99_9DINO|nr:unnamed protein product [Symbiodinium natans]
MGSTCAVSISEKLQVLQASGKPPEAETPQQTLQLRQLHEACRRGDAVAARRSLEQGAPATGRDETGWAPLHYSREVVVIDPASLAESADVAGEVAGLVATKLDVSPFTVRLVAADGVVWEPTAPVHGPLDLQLVHLPLVSDYSEDLKKATLDGNHLAVLEILSGRTVPVPWDEELSVKRLKALAEQADGSVLRWGDSLKDAGLQVLYATVSYPRLLSARHFPGFLLMCPDGTAQGVGASYCFGEFAAVRDQIHHVEDVCFTTGACAVLRSDGITWGGRDVGGCGPADLASVTQICSTFGAVAALRADGSVVAWGNPDDGGDCSQVRAQLQGVDRLYSSGQSFAAVRQDGSVVTWGDCSGCGSGDSSDVQDQLKDPIAMTGNCGAFAALLGDGSIVCWGDPASGGDCSQVRPLLATVTALYSNDLAFAAVRADGRVVTWGGPKSGGASGIVQARLRNVRDVKASDEAFAALLEDGTVVTWGYRKDGGDCRPVQDQLQGIRELCASSNAFAALRQDGCVVTWGKMQMPIIADVQSLWGALGRFAVVLSDGRVVVGCQTSASQFEYARDAPIAVLMWVACENRGLVDTVLNVLAFVLASFLGHVPVAALIVVNVSIEMRA